MFQKEDEIVQLEEKNNGFVANSKLLAKKNTELEDKVSKLLSEVEQVRDQEAVIM